MGQPYAVVNEFSGSLTGHVDITLYDGNGGSITYGSNVAPDSGFQVENDTLNLAIANGSPDNPLVSFSPEIPLTQSQYDSINSSAQSLLADNQFNGVPYTLPGNDCVNTVRTLLADGGVNDDVSQYLTNTSTPVYVYAQATDELSNIGGISAVDLFGEVVGDGVDLVTGVGQDLAAAFQDTLNGNFSGVAADFAGIGVDISQNVGDAFNAVSGAVQSVWNSLTGSMTADQSGIQINQQSTNADGSVAYSLDTSISSSSSSVVGSVSGDDASGTVAAWRNSGRASTPTAKPILTPRGLSSRPWPARLRPSG